MFSRHAMFATVAVLVRSACAIAQLPDDHAHHAATAPQLPPPRVLLDKSPRIVAYQLDRLSNDRLLQVERDTSDVKYRPVYEAILLRPGIATADRDECIAALAEIDGTDRATTILHTLAKLDETDARAATVADVLTERLVAQEPSDLARADDSLQNALGDDSALTRRAAIAALITAGEHAGTIANAKSDPQATADLLLAIRFISTDEERERTRPFLLDTLAHADDSDRRRHALEAISYLPGHAQDTFKLLAEYVHDDQLRPTVVAGLLRLPRIKAPAEAASAVVNHLIAYALSTPTETRTAPDFLDAMRLADELLARLPADDARRLRAQLADVTVRVVQIATVLEEMRYDQPYFAVAAGKPVQIVLENRDIMPHNFVVTAQGALETVAHLAAQMTPDDLPAGQPYVPDSELVFTASEMVPVAGTATLTFTAPTSPGEYPYVCTFPRHWMRMYGVMVVVEDLDAWLENPRPPTDPLGGTQAIVKNWTIDDFPSPLESHVAGQDFAAGAQLFRRATCHSCHQIRDDGGAVGPPLTDVLTRYKGGLRDVLREIIDPSHTIEAKYVVHLVETSEGQFLSGIITAQDESSVTLVTNPESPRPVTVRRADIEVIEATASSMMPKGLLDTLTEPEIYALLAYLAAGGDTAHPIYSTSP